MISAVGIKYPRIVKDNIVHQVYSYIKCTVHQVHGASSARAGDGIASLGGQPSILEGSVTLVMLAAADHLPARNYVPPR